MPRPQAPARRDGGWAVVRRERGPQSDGAGGGAVGATSVPCVDDVGVAIHPLRGCQLWFLHCAHSDTRVSSAQ